MIWEKQKTETAREYEYFVTYRDFGPERSTQKVANKHKKSRNHIGKISMENRWVARCKAYDEHRAKKDLEEKEAMRSDMAKRHLSYMRALGSIAMLPIQALVDRLKKYPEETRNLQETQTIDLIKLANSSARTLDICVKIERLTLGIATEISGAEESSNSGTSEIAEQALQNDNVAKKLIELLAELSRSGEQNRAVSS